MEPVYTQIASTSSTKRTPISSGPTFTYTEDSGKIFKAMTATPGFQLDRIECMDGDMARNKETKSGVWGRGTNAQVGEVCRLLLQQSADTQADPAKRAERPDQDLLAPYRAIARDKGYIESNPNAQAILNIINNNAVSNAAVTTTKPIHVRMSTGQDLVVSAGGAFDASLTQSVLDFLAGKPAPKRVAPQYTNDQLTIYEEGCHRNNDTLTIAQCNLLGKEVAAEYITRRFGASR